MFEIDMVVLEYLNQYARVYSKLDLFVNFICHNHLLKRGIFMIIVYFLWFQKISRSFYT